MAWNKNNNRNRGSGQQYSANNPYARDNRVNDTTVYSANNPYANYNPYRQQPYMEGILAPGLRPEQRDMVKSCPRYSIDVECVATGPKNCQRTVAKVSIVDSSEKPIFTSLVKPKEEVFSYLTQLTGITEEDLRDAESFEQVTTKIRDILPKNAIIVGQGINHDMEWLQFKEGTDYHSTIDLGPLFGIRNPPGHKFPMRLFSLRHVCLTLLSVDIQEGIHDPTIDAQYSMRLFNLYHNCGEQELGTARQTLLAAPPTPGISKLHPVLDGVSMRRDPNCPLCGPRAKATTS